MVSELYDSPWSVFRPYYTQENNDVWTCKTKKKKKITMWIMKHNKAVLEPRVSPAFTITYFCNHCNIRFDNTSKYGDTLTLFSKNLNQRSLTPRWPLTPCLLRSHVWLYQRIIVSKSHDNTSMYVDYIVGSGVRPPPFLFYPHPFYKCTLYTKNSEPPPF